jgi:hypothetical protein
LLGGTYVPLEVASEDRLEIRIEIDRVSVQVIEPRPSHVDQVKGEELDDEEVVICPTCRACKVVVLQPHIGIGFAVIFNNAIWHPKNI